jgi:hypothetical protein
MTLRTRLIAKGQITPHPELGEAMRLARSPWNPSVGPSLAQPWRRAPTQPQTLTRGPLMPEWDVAETFGLEPTPPWEADSIN